MAKTSHTVANANSQSFVCKNCGTTQPFPEFTIDITKFVEIGNKFIEKHKSCKPK